MAANLDRLRLRNAAALVLVCVSGVFWTARYLGAQDAAEPTASFEPTFQQIAKPFLQKNCVACHNADNPTSGVRLDGLNGALEDRHLNLWEHIGKQVESGKMPPKGMPQPSAADRKKLTDWIHGALDVARLRPAPKNGVVRRMTVAQYRNTLRELLQLEDDLTERLPPDAISGDGFVNNKETLQLSPTLVEAYFETAEEALNRSIVDPKTKPAVQNFRVDFGKAINKAAIPEDLILGAGSHLLENEDFTVTQLTAKKPFAIEPFFMRTKYRFIEGYQGNDTVRGWREYDSIYHAVFADVRGSSGYPKGQAYSTVPQGLLLRPAIPNEEQFDADGTYGPKANFKIAMRELPDNGRFRVTLTAAKYNDGLLLDPGAKPRPADGALTWTGGATVNIAKAGVYQVDVHAAPVAKVTAPAPNKLKLSEGLAGYWPMDSGATGKYVDSPFGKALSLGKDEDGLTIPRTAAMNVGEGEFTVSAWIHPRALRKSVLIGLGGLARSPGWTLQLDEERGQLRLDTAGGFLESQTSVIKANIWQHVAAVVRRGKNETRMYVNGFLVAKGVLPEGKLDNPKADLHIGRIPNSVAFRGDVDEVRIHKRALSEAELQGLIEPGKQFVKEPGERALDATLTLAGRVFTGTLKQPAFAVMRLPAGPVAITAALNAARDIDKVVFTPLPADDELAKRFAAFEKRAPRVGVHLGLRRDCGSSLLPVGPPQTVSAERPQKYIFEGAIRNFPNPEVEKDNVNYLAGVREIGVRSEYTDGRDMPRVLIQSIEFEGPFYESWPPPTHRSIFIDSPRKNDPAAYAREIIRNFATKAYRRPVTASEEAGLLAIYTRSAASGRGFQDSVKDALVVALTSPQFLFLIENSATPGGEALDNYELSSKLSYFLWNAPPDRTTLQLAANGTLPKQLDAEVDRMTKDPRFSQFVREFGAQWLALEKFQVLEPDRKRYPKLTRDARVQLAKEPVQFLEYLFRQNLPLKNLISSDFVVANETVASYYDLGDKTENGFQFLPISHGRREMGGVLTQAAIMAGLSDGRESNPVKRGVWLARKIIAEPPDPPPPNVPALKESSEGLTLRQRIEQHRNQPGCQQCHSKIDPWGVAFEQYDAGGRMKTKPADAHSVLPDKTEVDGIDGLRKYLAEDRIDQVAFSVVKHLAIYGTGRSLTYQELNFLKQDAKRLRADGYRMKDMIRYVVTSKMFLEK